MTAEWRGKGVIVAGRPWRPKWKFLERLLLVCSVSIVGPLKQISAPTVSHIAISLTVAVPHASTLSLSLSLSLLSPSKSRRRRRRRYSSVFSSSLLFPFSSVGKEVWACPSFLCLCFSLFSTYAWFSSAKPSWKSIFVFWSPRDWHTRQWLLTKKRPQPPTGQDLWSSGLGSSLIVKMVSVRITAPETFFTLLKNYLIWLKRPKIKKNRPIFKKTLPTC